MGKVKILDERLVYVGGTPILTDKKMREREQDDWYETDRACLKHYFGNHLPRGIIPHHGNILDPAAGRGVYGDILREIYPATAICGIELKPEFNTLEHSKSYDAWYCDNFLVFNNFEQEYDVIVTNPPYKHAEEFFHTSLLYMPANGNGSIIFLLRLGFLASQTRYESMWSKGYSPTEVTVLNTRPSFTGDGKTYPGDFCMVRWTFENGKCKQDRKLSFMVYERK